VAPAQAQLQVIVGESFGELAGRVTTHDIQRDRFYWLADETAHEL
jgi:hypothetical protein